MSLSRRRVLERLFKTTDSDAGDTTTAATLAARLDSDVETVESHLRDLVSCELAHCERDGRVRITITGRELLELDLDELVIVDADGNCSSR